MDNKTTEAAAAEGTGRPLTQKDLLDVMEAVLKEQSGIYQRLAAMESRVADLEADRDQVVNRHIEKRLFNGSWKDACDIRAEACESPLSRIVRRLRNG